MSSSCLARKWPSWPWRTMLLLSCGVSTGGSDGYFVNINLESVKSKLTNSHPFFNSPIKYHFPKETPSSEMAPVPPHHPLCSEYLVVFIQGTYHQHSYLLSRCSWYHGATFCLSCCCRHGPPRSPSLWLGCWHRVLRSLPFQVLPTPGCIEPCMGDTWPSALQRLLSVCLRGAPTSSRCTSWPEAAPLANAGAAPSVCHAHPVIPATAILHTHPDTAPASEGASPFFTSFLWT